MEIVDSVDQDNKERDDPGRDLRLIQRALHGDESAFAGLVQKYEGKVFGILRKHLPEESVEEVAQDVFVKAYRSLGSFRKKGSFQSWLSTIAVRACCDFWRRRYKKREQSLSSLTENQRGWVEKILKERSGVRFEESARRKEAAEVLDWALSRMSADDRMVLELVHLEGLSGKEVAKLLGTSVAVVKVRAFRARIKLRRVIEAELGDGDYEA